MNIFVSNPNPLESALILDDKRLIKMILETAQLMSTAINLYKGVSPYKTTHKNHPCAIWVRTSNKNYSWTLKHFKALSNEYTRRFGRIHKCYDYICLFESGKHLMPIGELTQFQNCTQFKHITNVFEAYQFCLNDKWNKDKNPKWTLSNPPLWKKDKI